MAALLLARAGARVLIVDRDSFPRPKLCGDTLNPGALGLLADQGLSFDWMPQARTLAGMLVTAPGARVVARYPAPQHGVSITRHIFDAWLLQSAIAAGARFEPRTTVTGALRDSDSDSGAPLVRGVVVRRHDGSTMQIPATMTIAAEGRRSPAARSLGLIAHPRRPRRWAFGAYASGVTGLSDLGEMHVRPRRYIGVAPLTGGLVNVCVVTTERRGAGSPRDMITQTIADDRRLRDRFAKATFETNVHVLGPLAVDAKACGVPGLLLAGDASGFIDPMTGDGLHLAMRGAVLAAEEALAALESGDLAGSVTRLALRRQEAFGSKLRFNRGLRGLVGSPIGVRLAGCGAIVAPQVLRHIIRHAGDPA
jgi:flavin-dependent dehydrogenase